jgi:hypothetical protein
MSKVKSIIFNTPMVQAVLNTKPGVWPAEPIDPVRPYKCMTRRIIELQTEGYTPFIDLPPDTGPGTWYFYRVTPKYSPGDILWVREKYQIRPVYGFEGGYPYEKIPKERPGDCCITYAATDDLDEEKWRPSIFMPRWASRLTLEVKDVRIERLQDITDKDVWLEGVEGRSFACEDFWCPEDENYGCLYPHTINCEPICRFRFFWDHLNAKGGHSWDSNPCVFVIEFMRMGNETTL